MRKTLVMAAVGVMVGGGVARAGDPDVGCGWGTQLFRGKSGAVYKVMAATTNASLGDQTFGISSGTAGCHGGGVIRADVRLRMYAGANIDRLAGDMAAGGGESLDVLAHLMRIDQADQPAFFQLTKAHFAALFPSAQTTAGEMLTRLTALMADDARLAKYVS